MSSEAIRGFFRGRATRLAVIFAFLLSAALVYALARGGPPVPAAPPDPDLSLTKADSPDPVNAGAQLTYTLTVTNNGPE